MNSALDYEQIAHLYDSYLHFSDDLPFFFKECKKNQGSVLELMCGTGRISIPLLEAGVNLTCVDASPAMLNILRQKLAVRGLSASVVQADVTNLNWESSFDLVLLPFQSFHELPGEVQQHQALLGIARSLKQNGQFICTLHNPIVRLQSIHQGSYQYGSFPREDGLGFVSLSVNLKAELETGIVRGWQTIYELDAAQKNIAEHTLPVQFSLIELEEFQKRLQSANLEIEQMFGNYDYSPFDPQTSPYMIVFSRKTKT